MTKNITFREPEVTDAKTIVDFYNQVGGETFYLSFGKDEYPLSVKALKEEIASVKESSNNIMILALDGDKIVCIGTISSTAKVKGRHVGELGIVVTEEYQGQGIGTEMIKRLIAWSKGNGITTKIQLDTLEVNKKAVKLYQDFGFEIEGNLRNSTLYDGKYYNLLVMGLML
ncbi:MAG TPA: GNAT family N-acetyltransferase [Candidatus Dorea intestinavium]|nr:GNAT family N-acetyltransferase [Candidatus Dorea intestinavium]